MQLCFIPTVEFVLCTAFRKKNKLQTKPHLIVLSD